MRESPLSTAEKEFILKCLSEGIRIDKREPFEFRPITINFNRDLGCCICDLGETKVMVQVAAEIDRPRESRQNEGKLAVHVEMSQMASPSFNPGKPGDLGIELQRMLERSIVLSRSVDLEELCVRVGERVWKVSVHVHILSHDGNLLDCASIACISALAHFRRPDVSVTGKDVVIYSLEDKQPVPLVINHYPFCVSFGLFNGGERLVLDPIDTEEKAMDGRLMIAMNRHREVCCMQMSGDILINKEQVMRCTNIAFKRVTELTDLVKTALENDVNEKKSGKCRSVTTNKKQMVKSKMAEEDSSNEVEMKNENIKEEIKEHLLKQSELDKNNVGDRRTNTWVVDSISEGKINPLKEPIVISDDETMGDSEEESVVVMQQSDVGVYVTK